MDNHVNDDISNCGLLRQMAVRQEGTTCRKFLNSFAKTNPSIHEPTGDLLIYQKIHDDVHSHSSLHL